VNLHSGLGLQAKEMREVRNDRAECVHTESIAKPLRLVKRHAKEFSYPQVIHNGWSTIMSAQPT
jgi:hypothetical protein